MKLKWTVKLLVLGIIALFYLPLIVNKEIFLSRNNDLDSFFVPMIIQTKRALLGGELPMWNLYVFSGTPLLPDPQSPLTYPLNIPLLLLPTETMIVVFIILHGLLAFYFFYRLATRLGFSTAACILTALLYMSSPRLASIIEAGHLGLIAAWAWIPLFYELIYASFIKPKKITIILASLALALIFLSHLVTWLVILLTVPFILLYIKEIALMKRLVVCLVIIGLSLAVSSYALVPQLKWSAHTNRESLLFKPEVYPIWNGKKDFIQSLFIETRGISTIKSLDTEKVITVGSIPLVVSIIGFLLLKRRRKIAFIITVSVLLLVTLNNASPIYNFLLKNPLYLMMRVSTRFFVPITIILLILVASALGRIKNNILVLLLGTIMVTNSYLLSFVYFTKPISSPEPSPNKETLNYLSKNSSSYRVTCPTRCIHQKDAIENNLWLMEGYGTLPQRNYVKKSWGLFDGYWSHYSLAIPPMGSDIGYPNPELIGEVSTKFILSAKPLPDESFDYKFSDGKYFVYENTKALPLVYIQNTLDKSIREIPFEVISNRKIKVIIPKNSDNQLVLSYVYSPGWTANIADNKIEGLETPTSLIKFDIPQSEINEFVITYTTPGFYEGLVITSFSFLVILFLAYRTKTELRG